MLSEEEREYILERDAIMNLGSVLKTQPGREFMKYLFRTMLVGDVPPAGLSGELLHDMLGAMRAGKTVYNLAAQADAEVVATLMAQNEKERYAQSMVQSNERREERRE